MLRSHKIRLVPNEAKAIYFAKGCGADAVLVIGRGSRHERLISRDSLINMSREVYRVPNNVYDGLARLADSRSLGHAKLAEQFEALQTMHEAAFEKMRSCHMGTSGL